MKKIIFLIMFTLMSINTARADEGKDYVIVNMGIGYGDGGRAGVSIPSFGYDNKNNIIQYTKEECDNTIMNYLKDEYYPSDTDMGKTFIIYYRPKTFDAYYCVKRKLWDTINTDLEWINYSKNNGLFSDGYELLHKDLKDFTEKMKSCGTTQFYYQRLPVPETPLICDKYSEENPIPVIAVKDIWEIEKEASQNKREFDEVLREFLKNKK